MWPGEYTEWKILPDLGEGINDFLNQLWKRETWVPTLTTSLHWNVINSYLYAHMCLLSIYSYIHYFFQILDLTFLNIAPLELLETMQLLYFGKYIATSWHSY